MTYQVDSPIITKQINRWKISQIGIYSPPKITHRYIILSISVGYNDAIVDTIWHGANTYRITGSDLDAIMGQVPTGATIYDAIKNTAYSYAIDKGYIPAEATEEQ